MKTFFGFVVLICAGFLLPLAEAANETKIDVVINFYNYRVRPQPKAANSTWRLAFVLKPDGSILDRHTSRGKFGKTFESDAKLGKRFRVLDDQTLERRLEFSDRFQVMTIRISGKRCRADMRVELKPGFTEFESTSTQLGVKAFYRDWRMTSSTCSIS